MSQAFSFSQRLHRREDFERVLKKKVLIDQWLALHFDVNVAGAERLGIVVSKRVVAKAVARNRLKRLIREVFRQYPAEGFSAVDIVVRVRKSLNNKDTLEFRRSLTRLLTKMRMAGK